MNPMPASTPISRSGEDESLPGTVFSPTEIMTIVSGCPMERSIAEASARLILWLEADYGWDRWRAYDLLTHVARHSIGYYALGTVAVAVGKQYL